MSDELPRRETDPERHERRTVDVHDPRMSESTNARVTDEVRAVLGADQVDVPVGRPRVSRGETVRHRRTLPVPFPLPDDFALAEGGAALAVVAAIIALALVVKHWWTLTLAVIVLFAFTYLVVAMIMKMTTNPERPDPTVIAAMEEDGVSDPEQLFSDVVHEFTPDVGASGENVRETAVEDDPAKAAAEQRSATTPSGGPTRPVGPGSGGSGAGDHDADTADD